MNVSTSGHMLYIMQDNKILQILQDQTEAGTVSEEALTRTKGLHCVIQNFKLYLINLFYSNYYKYN